MAQNRRPQYQGKRKTVNRGAASDRPAQAPTTTIREPTPPVVYGKPFVVLEAVDKSTFIYRQGEWAPHDVTIAQMRKDCQVKELPQKVKQMTRYEVRSPVE